MATVQLQEVSRTFENFTAVEDITFQVPDGEFWVLVGPSGCGKSTILRTIAGLERATTGNIYIGQQRVNELPARQRDVAMVFQNYALYPHMSVADNLAFGLRMRQTDPQTVQERINTVATALGIHHLLKRKPKQLSGGQQQRVALGRAIARQPQVFLLDEPLSNLDAQLREDTRAELKQLHQRLGITTLYVTHDQIEAMTLADQLVVLDRGRIQQVGEPQTIYHQPVNRMVATFLGSPPMNMIPALSGPEGFKVGNWLIPCPPQLRPQSLSAARGKVDLGIRPEHVQIVAEDDASHVQAEITLVEPLGRETLLRGLIGYGSQMPIQICTTAGSYRPGDRLFLRLDLDHLQIFDAASGNRLV